MAQRLQGQFPRAGSGEEPGFSHSVRPLAARFEFPASSR